MISLDFFRQSRRQSVRSIVCLSLCATLPLPSPASEPPAATERHALGGPGWYDSSWDLVRGLDIAEVPDLEAELGLWIEACFAELTLG